MLFFFLRISNQKEFIVKRVIVTEEIALEIFIFSSYYCIIKLLNRNRLATENSNNKILKPLLSSSPETLKKNKKIFTYNEYLSLNWLIYIRYTLVNSEKVTSFLYLVCNYNLFSSIILE